MEWREFAKEWFRTHDTFWADLQPYVLIVMNFGLSEARHIPEGPSVKMREIPLMIPFGPKFYEKHINMFNEPPDSINAINFFAEEILNTVKKRMNQMSDDEGTRAMYTSSNELFNPDFQTVGEIYAFNLTGLSFQLITPKYISEIPSTYETTQDFKDTMIKDNSMILVNGIVGARTAV